MIAAPAMSATAPAYPMYAVPRMAGVTVPGLPPVTGRITVDQFGYLPDEDKVAVISDPQKGYNVGDRYAPGKLLEVRRRTDGTVVHRGAPAVWNHGATDDNSGDRGWWFDFSAVKEPGEYYIYDGSTKKRSPVFRIGTDVYHRVLVAATRMYFYQREATPIQPPYAEQPWVFDAELVQDREARFVDAKNDPKSARDLHGGWMDAGDTDKYPTFNPGVIHPLLHAWRENPEAFGDDFGIPESGNGLPDLLDEVKFQLEWLMRMQQADGGVLVKMGFVDFARVWPLANDHRPRYYGPENSASSLAAAGMFAHAARVYGQFDPWKPFAADLRARAIRAWDWAMTHPRDYKPDTGEIKSGLANRGEKDHDRLEFLGAVHLWALTGDPKYHAVVLKRAPATRQLGEGEWSVYEAGSDGEALLDYASLPGADPGLVKRIRDQLARTSANESWRPEADLYRAWFNPDSFHWGSVTPHAYFGVVALEAARGGGLDDAAQARLRQRALNVLHYFHGVNPLSMVYLTNMGKLGAELSASRIWNERFNFNTPHASNPPPGYLIGGQNQGYAGKNKDGEPDTVGWIRQQPRGKAYADFNEPWPLDSWELTENGIYYQAAYIRLLSRFARPPAAAH